MKQKQKKLIFSLVVVFIVLGAVIFVGVQQTGFRISNNLVTSAKLISEDATSATYSFSFTSDMPGVGDCNEASAVSYSFDLPCSPSSQSSLPKFADNLKDGGVATGTPSLSGINVQIRPCSDITHGGQYITDTGIAKCTVKKAGIKINGEEKACVSCVFEGSGHIEDNGLITSGLVNGVSGGSTQITFYKEGAASKYFRLQDNTCTEIELIEADKTVNDFLTYDECSLKIVAEVQPSPSETVQVITDTSNEIVSNTTVEDQLEILEHPEYKTYGIIAFIIGGGLIVLIVLGIVLNRKKR